MPRPVKCRKVCHFPNVLEFLPADDTEKKMPIVLTVDEYETIRLLDKKGYSQEQCAVSMQIARTTVQRIYEIARKKIADALIDGHPLRIEGGDFRICDGQSGNCSFGGCYKQEIYKKYAAGIKLFGGVSGDADKAVEAFINDTLDYNPDVKCSHHEHNHGEGHTCGEHGCGNHSCH